MPQLKFSPHPVRLTSLWFPELQLKRNRNLNPPLVFPAFTLEAKITPDIEKRSIVVELQVNSAKGKPKSGVNTKPVASFALKAHAKFVCADFENAQRAMTEFSASASPYQLMWPYVRSALVQLLVLGGLPPFHLPLVIAWTMSETGAMSSIPAGEQAE